MLCLRRSFMILMREKSGVCKTLGPGFVSTRGPRRHDLMVVESCGISPRKWARKVGSEQLNNVEQFSFVAFISVSKIRPEIVRVFCAWARRSVMAGLTFKSYNSIVVRRSFLGINRLRKINPRSTKHHNATCT